MQSHADEVRLLCDELKISALLAQLLINRGFRDPARAHRFLYPRLEDLHDPYLMRDMDRVVSRIFLALQERQKIFIYGDYDVDGITSTAVLKRALEMLGGMVGFYLPQRLKEGYGLRKEILHKAQAEGYQLVISVDSGVRAFEACQAARERNLDLIVTDHHLPDSHLPSAYAVLNPRRPDCSYPDKNLAAVGVVFKLVHALFRKAGKETVVKHFLKLVAIGTIADVVPLSGENRVLVKFGLEGLATPHNIGLQALMHGSGVGSEVNFFDVGFKLAPRINAVSRMGGGHEAVDLFSVQDPAQAEGIVRFMNESNWKRQQEERRILAEIEQRIRQNPQSFQKNFLVLRGRNWHRGVIGIVASRLVERFHRPVLVLSTEDSGSQGSGRSIPGFHLLEAFDHCQDLFLQYGGHAQAVGCTLGEPNTPDKVQELATRLAAYADANLSPQQLIPSLEIESLLSIKQISFALYDELQQLAPFGTGNPLPVFASHQVNVTGGPWVLKAQHLKFQVEGNGSHLDAIWWKKSQAAATITERCCVDLAYTVTRDRFQGKDKLLLTIRDIRRQ